MVQLLAGSQCAADTGSRYVTVALSRTKLSPVPVDAELLKNRELFEMSTSPEVKLAPPPAAALLSVMATHTFFPPAYDTCRALQVPGPVAAAVAAVATGTNWLKQEQQQ